MRLSVVSRLIGLFLLLTATSPVGAATATRIPRIGLLLGDASPRLDAFRQGLRALGYIEGQNIELDCKLTEGKYETLQKLTAELIAAKADIIVTGGHSATRAAMDSTSTIPIVFASASDPLASGFVKSLARPGGNATGLSLLSHELTEKRFEILHEVVPKASRIAALYTPDSRASFMQFEETEATAHQAGIALQALEVRRPTDFSAAFGKAVRGRANALLVVQSTFTLAHKTTLARLATTHRLPAMYGSSEFVAVGGFMSYGADALDMYRRTASYVDRLLKGSKPGDLPVEQPSKFELSINLKTAKSLGLTFPASVLVRADRVFE